MICCVTYCGRADTVSIKYALTIGSCKQNREKIPELDQNPACEGARAPSLRD